jgi:hypothetical protein
VHLRINAVESGYCGRVSGDAAPKIKGILFDNRDCFFQSRQSGACHYIVDAHFSFIQVRNDND